MKRFFSFLLAGLFVGAPFPVSANVLNEGQLFTDNQECQLHYLTDKNITGWHFDIQQGVCQNKLAQGQMHLTVFDAFQQPVTEMNGFFNQGYFVGNTPLQNKVLTRSTDNQIQKLTFLMGKDDTLGAQFIGQMSADVKADNQYGPFILCEPFKILVVSNNTDLFKEQTTQRSLFERAKQFAIQFCPMQENIMLFGSTKIDPTQNDIFFYADLNIAQENAHILKTPDTFVPKETKPQFVDGSTTPPYPAAFKTTVQPAQPSIDEPMAESTTRASLTEIPALILLSKVTRTPVEGHFPIYVDQLNPDNSVFLPKQHLTLRGKALKHGWQVVFGEMQNNKTPPTQPLSGTFEVTRSIPCATEKCLDYHEANHEI